MQHQLHLSNSKMHEITNLILWQKRLLFTTAEVSRSCHSSKGLEHSPIRCFQIGNYRISSNNSGGDYFSFAPKGGDYSRRAIIISNIAGINILFYYPV